MYLCKDCKKEFDDATAYCEDWRLPEKRFGCPHCKIFYKVANVKRDPISYIPVIIFLLASKGAIDAIFEDAFKTAFYFGLISILASIFWYYKVPASKYIAIEYV